MSDGANARTRLAAEVVSVITAAAGGRVIVVGSPLRLAVTSICRPGRR